MAVEHLPLREHPKLFDQVIQYVQQGLKDNISWLEYSFGRAERLIKVIDGQRYYTPNVYVGKQNYELVMPDTFKLGNYSFFVMDEPQEVTNATPLEVKIHAPFSLIVWVDMRTIDNDDERNTEAIKEEILTTLQRLHIKKGSINVSRIFEKAENVWQGFTTDEAANQFMMSPYYGVRFYGEMTITNDCVL